MFSWLVEIHCYPYYRRREEAKVKKDELEAEIENYKVSVT